MANHVQKNRLCNAGYYSNGADCLLCPTGQWSGAVGVTACQACTNAPSGGGTGLAYYLSRSTTTTTNACPWCVRVVFACVLFSRI